ncbi:MAG: MarR family winged helix-turn-helix transcriptional regulator [Bacteroidota bacterium]
MRLEDEIHQKSFGSEGHKLAVNIIFTYNWLHSHHSDFLKNYGLSLQQYNVLRILRGMNGEPVSVKTVRERMLDRMSDVSRIIEKLRTKGWVKRTTCEEDRRACDVSITQKGLDLLKQIDSEFHEVESLLDRLDDERKRELNALLDALRS